MTEIHSYMEALMLAEEDPILLEPGQTLFEQGEPGRDMYIVRTGFVLLRVGGSEVEQVARGGLLGEMALIDPAPRSASAVAGENCSVVAITEGAFHALVKQVPGFALEVMRSMARRLRQSNASA
jgi:CRP-like cAMP-binding protein